jgi:hypothetical protein
MEKQIFLSQDQSERLRRFAQAANLSEDQVVEQALELFFSFQDNALLSETALQRVWDNEQDAAYDHWQDLYDVPKG